MDTVLDLGEHETVFADVERFVKLFSQVAIDRNWNLFMKFYMCIVFPKKNCSI
jgi:hypothetical protein